MLKWQCDQYYDTIYIENREKNNCFSTVWKSDTQYFQTTLEIGDRLYLIKSALCKLFRNAAATLDHSQTPNTFFQFLKQQA